jgi:hypothetical protein
MRKIRCGERMSGPETPAPLLSEGAGPQNAVAFAAETVFVPRKKSRAVPVFGPCQESSAGKA